MEIQNANLNELEVDLLTKITQPNYSQKKTLVEQINSASVAYNRDNNITISFNVDEKNQPISSNRRVPIELEILHPPAAPTLVLLHVVDGYIYELEILNADSAPVTDISFVGQYTVKSNDDWLDEVNQH